MKEIIISARDEGGRLDKYLKKLLPGASGGFLYKMLRKKNITLNGGKAQGTEVLKRGDRIRVFFSDETYAKFSGQAEEKAFPDHPLEILYEDEDFIFVNKPCGMLTQKAAPEDVSLAEYLPGYLLARGKLTEEEMKTFRPAPMNRLDRNTSGIVLCARTRPGAAFLAEILREDGEDRRVAKEYLTITTGQPRDTEQARVYYKKNATENKVTVSAQPFEGSGEMVTGWRTEAAGEDYSLVRVRLYTGRPHQIRAHLAFAGTPVAGDRKYGSPSANRELERRFGLSHQLLHAERVTFGDIEGRFERLSGRSFSAPLPEQFVKIMKGLHLSEHEG